MLYNRVNPKGDKQVTFTEYLKTARDGDKNAYGMLCNDCADGLYAIAYLTLNTSEDAEEAVRNAFSDGFSAINRIKDRGHLRAWLARELTKHIVNRLKQYRTDGEPTPENTDARRIFSQLSGLDRLVCALNLTYGYDSHEISIITGLTEEAAARKLENSDKKLGAQKAAVSRCIMGCKAPESLYTKEKPHLIPFNPPQYSTQPIRVDSEITEPVSSAKKIEFSDISEKPHSAAEQEIPAETPGTLAKNDASAENKTEKTELSEAAEKPQTAEKQTAAENHKAPREIDARMFIGIISAQHIKGGEFLQLMGNTRISNNAYREIEQNPNLTKERLITLLEESGLTTEDYYKLLAAVKRRSELISQKNTSDTRSFTYKDNDELQLNTIAPTRSEPVPPQEKPDKSKLIADIEADEIQPAKPKALEPEAEQQSGDPLSVTTILGSLGKESGDIQPAKPKVLEPEAEQRNDDPLSVTTILSSLGKESEEIQPAKPKALEPEAEQRNGDPLSVTTILGSLGKESEKIQPAKPKAPEPEAETVVNAPTKDIPEKASEQPYRPNFDADSIALTTEIDEPIMQDEPVTPAKPKVLIPPTSQTLENPLVTGVSENEEREKYKSNEFFYNDNAYEPGINNGKIAFCAVCAVLLIAASFGIRYAATGSLLPTKNAAVSQNEPEKNVGIDPSAIITDEDVKTAINKLTLREQKNSLDEYCTGSAYENALKTDVIEVGDIMYIYSKNTLRAVELNEEKPMLIGEAKLAADGEFIGFTANEKYVYALLGTPKNDSEREKVTVEIYDSKLNLLNTYKQDGSCTDVLVGNETLTLFTSLNTFGEENALPAYEFDGERCILTRGDIEIPENIAYNSFSVFGTISANEARAQAVLGGYDSYAVTNLDSFTLLVADFNRTYALKYRIIGLNSELQSQEYFDGECFGKSCMNASGDVFAVYDSAAGCTKIQKKINGEYISLGSLGADERLSGVSFSGDLVYVVTTSADGAATLYCGDTSGSALTEITPDPDAVYTQRLARYKNDLIGLSAVAGGNGERTGLRLSVYGYDGKLTERYGTDITVDEKTAPEYVRYLSGDAEENSSLIAAGDGYAAVSCIYFDGVSEIERFLCFKDTGDSFETSADIMLFDIQSDYRFISIRGGILYIVTDSTIVTVDIESGNPTGYFPYEE